VLNNHSSWYWTLNSPRRHKKKKTERYAVFDLPHRWAFLWGNDRGHSFEHLRSENRISGACMSMTIGAASIHFFFRAISGGGERSPPTFRIYSLSSLSWATSHLHFAFCLSMQVCNQFHIQNYGICWIYRLTSEELIQSADHGMLHRPESPSVHEWFRFFSRSWFDLTIPMYLRHWR